MSAVATRESVYRDTTRAALVGLFINLALGVAKLAGGLAGESFALIADALNSLGDCISSFVVLFALWVAQKPPDAEHPYGHTRAEAIAGSNVALVIILSALFVGWEALGRLTAERKAPAGWTLWMATANVVIKEALYRYKMRVGRRTGSSAVVANAWDHRNDALCSLAVLVGLALSRFGGAGWAIADQIAALVVVSAILVTGVHLFRTSASELMDVQADDELVRQVRIAAAEVPGVAGVEKLWLRKSGLEYFADIHIEVDAQMTVAEGHEIGHLVKDRLLSEFPTLRDALVHLEPYPHQND